MKIILASNSPRRKQLLAEICDNFVTIPAVGEEVSTATSPIDKVKELACRKATEVFAKCQDNCCVIGCDTIVDLDGQVLGKPKDAIAATQMLQSLSGRSHLVHTGMCIMSQHAISLFCQTTEVTFRLLTSTEIADYVERGSPFDKAGGYGIQDSNFVSDINGSYFNVMGFPTERIAEELQKIAINRG